MLLYFLINLFVILIFVALFIIFKRNNKNWLKVDDYLGKITTTINSIRYGNLATKIEKIKHPNYESISDSINRMVETLNDREKMIVEYQSELTRQNKFLEATINSLSDGILIIDEHHKILRTTPQILKWFDAETKNIIGHNLKNFIQPKQNTNFEELNNDEIFVKNKPKLSFVASTTLLTLDDRKKRFIIIIKDISSQKEIDKLKEDFVATLTHDLKVPIIAESNILDFLINGKFGEINEKQHEAIANMKACNKELLNLVQILLETYKTKETGIELVKENIRLNKFVKEIAEEMNPIAEKSGMNINFTESEEIELNADYSQLKRVIKNLIQNAISHSESNKDIEIEIEKEDKFINIKIIDYGKGISKEDIEKIFDKYYSAVNKFRKIGTGLGLYLSQQIIKSHGGEIIVKSEENINTVFCIQLPV